MLIEPNILVILRTSQYFLVFYTILWEMAYFIYFLQIEIEQLHDYATLMLEWLGSNPSVACVVHIGLEIRKNGYFSLKNF